MHTQLAKSIYKTALRRAIAFDKEPVLKVGLFSSPSDCSVLSPRSPLTGTIIKSKTDRRKKETIAKIAWTPFSGFHFILVPPRSHNQFYSMDRSLSAFLRQQVQQTGEEEKNYIAFLSSTNSIVAHFLLCCVFPITFIPVCCTPAILDSSNERWNPPFLPLVMVLFDHPLSP